MSKNTRWALAIAGVVILAVAAFAISSSKKSTKATVQPETTQSTGATAGGSSGASGAVKNDGATGGGNNSGGATPQSGGNGNGTGGAKPEDDNGTGGAKVSTEQGPLLVAGKVAKIDVNKGDTVYLRARSAKDDELHIHGYDYKVDLPAGKTVSYKFKADIGGAFVLEFENEGLQVAALKVNP